MEILVIEGPSPEAMNAVQREPQAAAIPQTGFSYYRKLEKKGKVKHYVRLDGPPGSILIFNVESLDEFAELRAADPLAPLLGENVKVIPLASAAPAEKFFQGVQAQFHGVSVKEGS